jgi:hypothetical protein
MNQRCFSFSFLFFFFFFFMMNLLQLARAGPSKVCRYMQEKKVPLGREEKRQKKQKKKDRRRRSCRKQLELGADSPAANGTRMGPRQFIHIPQLAMAMAMARA